MFVVVSAYRVGVFLLLGWIWCIVYIVCEEVVYGGGGFYGGGGLVVRLNVMVFYFGDCVCYADFELKGMFRAIV